MRSLRLSRRTLLRGSTAGVALPLLDAMVDGRGLLHGRAAAAGPPVYFLTYFTPNGIHEKSDWAPAETGPSYTPRGWMKALEPFRGDLALVSSLRKQEMYASQDIAGDAHIRASGTFATGVGVTKTGAGGISADQVVANAVGAATRFKSLPVSLGRVTDPRVSHISWAAANQPVPAERDPEILFRRLFGGGVPAGAPAGEGTLGKYRKSVLDYVKGDLGRITARVGAADRVRLEAHAGALRELENQIARDKVAVASCRGAVAPGVSPALSNERAQLLTRLMVSALACDLTRVASFMLAGRSDDRVFSWIPGVTQGHHTISHLTSVEGRKKRLAIWTDEVEQFAFLLRLMKDTALATGGTLLDRSVVFFTSEHGDLPADSHYGNDMLAVIAGRAGGKLKTGMHLRAGAAYSNVWVTLLNDVMGIPTTEFGLNGKARIEGLAA